ncbi:MAG: histidine kinase [Acidobacteriota bacterium]
MFSGVPLSRQAAFMETVSISPRGSALTRWHSGIALGVYAATLGLLDGLHMALKVPSAGRPVIILHIVVGLFFYPVFVRLAVLLTRRFPLDVSTWFRNVVAHMAIGLTLQYLHYLIMSTLLVGFVWPVFYPGRMLVRTVIAGISASHFREYPIDLLAYWIVIGFVYASRYNSQLAEREVAAAKLEASLAEARLEVLRRQLSPHFLFNTLNAVSVLALRGENEAVVETLNQLSDLLRFAIDEHHPQTVPLADELAFLGGYLGIQQVRFGDRLKVELDVSPESLDALVPFMILQPIVENAIEHGVSEQVDGSTVTIRTTVKNMTLSLSVCDSGPGFGKNGHGTGTNRDGTNGNGIGLSNTRLRLAQLYGSRHAIEYGPSPSGGASVAITIPFEAAAIHA